MVYNVVRNKNGYSHSYSSNFNISCGGDINYSYLFQSTDSLYNKPKFKFALSSTSYKL